MHFSHVSSNLTIRQMRRGDAKAIAGMMRKLSDFHRDKSTVTADDVMSQCLGPHKRGHVWIAVCDKRPVGFVYAFDAYDFVINGLKRDLNLLYVDKAFRRQGIGEALVNCVAKDAVAKKCAVLFVKAVSSNKSANAFYANVGMEKHVAKRQKSKFVARGLTLKRMAIR